MIDPQRFIDAGFPTWASDDGAVVLVNGDCLQVMKLLEAGSVDMIWTDPPYGHSNADGDFLARRHEIMRDGKGGTQEPIANDDGDAMRAVVDGMLSAAVRVLNRDCCCCCCCGGGGGPSPTFAWLAQRMDAGGLDFFHSIIWDKRNPGVGWRYRRQHEMVMVSHRTGGKLLWADDSRKQPNIISISKPRDDWHPNEKPAELVEVFVVNHAPHEATILDPFTGSGTTGVACIRTGRKFLGIEIDRGYFDIAVSRCQRELARHPLFEPPKPKPTQRSLL